MPDGFKAITCPKCRTTRKPSDTAPEWQCPNCGVAYAKASEVSAGEARVVYQTSAAPERRGMLRSIGIVLAVCAAGAWAWSKRGAAPAGDVSAGKSAGQREVVLFATSWCGYCAATREFFAANRINYVEYDVERDAEGARKYEQLGFKGKGVPVILIDGDIIHGFNEQALRQALPR